MIKSLSTQTRPFCPKTHSHPTKNTCKHVPTTCKHFPHPNPPIEKSWSWTYSIPLPIGSDENSSLHKNTTTF